MKVLASLLRAVVSGALAWLAIQALLFMLVHSVPGGPVVALAGDFATAETQAAVTRSFALDRPLAEQFMSFVARMLQGDWGVSYFFRRPVATLISERLLPTLVLMVSALVIGLVAGRALGLWAASHARAATLASAATTAVYALPVFWVGQVLMLGPGLELGWFPVSGMQDARQMGAGALATLIDVAWHAVLPVTTLALQLTAFFATVTQAKARTEMAQSYVRAARARGLPEHTVIWGHVARNVSPQLVTASLNRFGLLLTGAVLVETLYAWPGLGRLLSTAILNRDHPVLLGAFSLIVALVILSSIAADIVQARLDPRIRAAGGA